MTHMVRVHAVFFLYPLSFVKGKSKKAIVFLLSSMIYKKKKRKNRSFFFLIKHQKRKNQKNAADFVFLFLIFKRLKSFVYVPFVCLPFLFWGKEKEKLTFYYYF